MKVGDIVTYIDDWKPNRKWYLLSIRKNNLCDIVLIRNNDYKNIKDFGNFKEIYLNANIRNLPLEKIKGDS